MEKDNCAEQCTTVSKCGIFEFMAKYVGMTVIHPGGFSTTRQLIDEAIHLTKKKGLSDKITFHVGDALNLPFDDAEFDIAISQAMLVLIEDKVRAIQEAKRVIRSNGSAGWLELSWKKPKIGFGTKTI